jgi:hypothetical protein
MRTLPQTKKRIVAVTLSSALAVMAGYSSMAFGENVTLSGNSEVPPVTTTAAGTGTITVDADRSVKGSVTVTGMTATASHIHEGAAGANTFAPAADAKLTEAQYAAYKAGNLYVNVHSAKNAGGEVRAQLKGS